MTALQVRDFPDQLYDRLKDYAAEHHRSVAQQTIVAVEQMLSTDDDRLETSANLDSYGENTRSLKGSASGSQKNVPHGFEIETEEERAARIAKRKALLERIMSRPALELPEGFPSDAELIREDRDHRFDWYFEERGLNEVMVS